VARSVAKITVDILRDPDWTGLSAAAQRLYALVILPQPKLTLCGYLDTISPARWSSLAADTHTDQLQAALDELEAHRFVVIDHHTEELIVRSFVKNDLDPNRLSANVSKGFWAAWKSIASPELRRTVVDNCPAEHWEKLAKHAPPDALQMRRSTPFERGPQPPPGRGTPTPSEREPAPPIESTLTCHQSPVTGQQQPVDAPPPPTNDLEPTAPQPAAAALVIDQALALLVDRAITRNPARSNPTGHRKAITEGIRRDHLDDAHDRLNRDPHLTAHQLADLLDPPLTVTPSTAPGDDSVQRHRAFELLSTPRCTICHGTTWLRAELLDDGTWGPVPPCPDCNPEARTA